MSGPQELSTQRRELIERLLRQKSGQSRNRIAPRERRGSLPVSYAQERLWFLHELQPGTSTYNVTFTIRFLQAVELEALRKTLDEIVARHEILRTTFSAVGDRPTQLIADPAPLPLEVIDVAGLPSDECAVRLDRIKARELNRSLDLASGPLLVATLVTGLESGALLFLTMHHIVIDGWSMTLLTNELRVLYEAFAAHRPSPLEPLPIQFADYAAWQREWLQGDVLEQQLNFWRGELADAPTLQLPTDRARNSAGGSPAAREAILLDQDVSTGLRELSRRAGATLYMTGLAAFSAFLSRYTGQGDIVVGTPVANRGRAETENLIGFFVNMLVLRAHVSPGMSFLDLLTHVKAVASGAFAHEAVPFEVIVSELSPTRDPGRNPIFQVTFAVTPAVTDADAPFELSLVEGRHARFDLEVHVTEQNGSLLISFIYNQALFDRDTVIRMLRHFATLVREAVADPAVRIDRLSLLADDERARFSTSLNETGREYPGDASVAALVERQAAARPEAVAVHWGSSELTYAALNSRANQLARHLRRHGVVRGSHVALSVERGPNLIIGMLAILKAGGAYVPLDPEYPAQRLAFMLEDTAPPVVLGEARLLTGLPPFNARVIRLDEDAAAIDGESNENLAAEGNGADIAYVMYTSGSTGRPKGVSVPHHAITRLVWTADYAPLTSSDVVAQASNASFDASTFEIWGALINGGKLVGVPKDIVLSPESLSHHLEQHGVTALFLTTALFNQVAREQPHAFAGVRHLMFGGEAVDPRAVSAVLNAGPPARLLHVYGPTENTTFSTWHEVKSVAEGATTIPIGRGISNSTVYVLDARFQLVPIGVPGEVFVGGEGLANGYLNQQALTAERFVPSPFGNGERLYRTGDVGRWTADGHVEFIGRTDEQVKIRGFRIEPGEVEALLATHSQVRAAAVLARETTPGVKRLIAYVVGVESGLDVAGLRAYLKDKLPDYMVPSAIVEVPALPLNANGKLDRQALPMPELSRDGSEPERPQTALEIQIARIWTQVLGVDVVGLHDNFFELGGDSILSIQIVARANDAGLRVTVKDLFRHQTVAELAVVVEGATQRPVFNQPATGVIRQTPIQRWFFEQALAEPHHFNQAVILQAARPIEAGVVEHAVKFLLERHDSLRARFRRQGDEWVQTIAPVEDAVPFTTVDLASVPEADVPAAIDAEASRLQASLSLEGPLMRAALFEVQSGPQRLLIVVHHLAIDAVSWRILLADLNRSCDQIARGEAPAAGARTSSAAAWAERLDERVRSEAFRAEVDVWQRMLAGSVAAVPVDRPADARDNTIGTLAHVSVSLSQEETRALLQDVPKAFRTQINDALLTALARTIARWTGGRAALIDLEGHGREEIFDDIDLSQTVGWFTSLFPVRLDLPEQADWLGVLKQVKESLRALPQRGLGYGVLRYLSDDPSIRAAMASLPSPEIGFNYLGQYDHVLDESGAWLGASDRIGSPCSPLGRRSHLLDVAGLVSGGCLRFDWMYSSRFHDRETIERLAADCLSGLRELIERCTADGVRGATPSDFPLVSLDQVSVDQISAQYPDFDTILPLSPLQQGLLVHTLRSQGDGAYIEQFSSTFEGRFDVEALHRAWQLILDRHEQLRAAFVWRDDQPIQVVVRKADLPWEFEDWTALSSEDQAARFEAQLADERTRGFDLSVAPAMRCSVTRLADRLHRITWSFHHILLDGWSVQLVLRDVTAAFDDLRGGREVVLPPAPAYREYLAWVRQQDRESAEQFWKETLNGLDEPTRLSLPAPEYPLLAYDNHWVELPETLTEQLSTIGRERQITMATIVEGAWAMLLARYTSKSDIVFGVTVAGRPPVVAGVQEMVGLFINTLPMRLRISDDATTLSLLQQLQARQLAMRDFEYAQLGEVQRWAGISNSEALFDTMLAFENYPIRRGVGRVDSELTLVDVHVVEQTHYPLTVVVVPGRSLKLRIGYDQQRYERATVERMGRHLTRVFEQIATDISAVFGRATLAEENECERIAAFETGRRAPYEHETMAALFARQAASRPDEIALRADGVSLTYGELDRRSNQLARYLRARGVGADVPVGVCLTGGFDLIVALLGVVKAGGAYLALDPGYPSARLALMIAETGAPFVITSGELGAQLKTSASLISLDRERSAIEAESFDAIASEATADHLAYICYTSGSTGQPKGVAVPHRAIVRLLFGADYAHFGPDEIWLQLAPVPFDASTLEIWGALLHGGRLVLASDRTPAPQALGDLLTAEGVTSIWLTASLYNTVIDSVPEALAGLRQLLIGGEALSIAHVQRGLETLPHTRIINGYGPTEGTTFTCCHPIAASSGTRPIPIGRPISNTTVYVLDAGMLRVPIGVAGELYIGGDGLARGYAGQAARTAERFVPDPFSQRPGQRLYRTGDLVRWTDDGLIDFLGRNDSQVKIRGFRIELGEIEAVLESHYAVRAAVVIARQDVPGVKRLVAYIVAPSMPDEIELSRHLRSRLPDYMVPAAFVKLDSLPLTPNGKIDRDALPEPDAVRAPVSRRPESDAEIAIARIWAEVLQTPEIGIDENFFDLGGDSILGIQICARATKAGWQITPKQLFEHQSVAGLAAVAKRLAATSPTKSVSDASGACPLLPIQRWFFEQDLPDAHHFNQAVMLTVEADVPAAIIEQALAAIVAHHDALRARFTKSADGWSVRIGPPQNSGPLLNRVVLSGDDVLAPAAGRAAAALQSSLDLQQGPLVRATLFEGPRRPRLLIVIHHLVVDTVSWHILLEDLETACVQRMAGEPIVLPSKTTSLRQWAERLAAHADSPALDDARTWWRSVASRPVARLPIDYPGGLSANTISTAAHIGVSLSRAETDALVQAVPRTYRTQINEVLLTALLQAMAPWTLSPSLLVDLEGHGREPLFDDVHVNRTVGWFTTIAPIHLKLPTQGNAADALLSVKEQLRSIGGGTLNYGLLRYGSSEPTLRATLANLSAEVGFNYLGRLELGSASGLFAQAHESTGPMSSPRQRRPHTLDVVGVLVDGQLHFDWFYCPLIHNRSTIDGLAQRYIGALKAIIACSSDEMVERFTPSDFPLARIEQRTIDSLSGRYRVQGIEDLYPASPLQQGMVFHSMATPGSSLFVTQLDCAFEGALDAWAMAGAWEAILARHPVLRTVFVVNGTDDIHQVVVRHARLPWVEEDWRSVPAAEQPERLGEWLREDRRRGFDLTRPPLLRVTLIRMADDRQHLVATHHHSLLDGWSFPLVFQELLADYRARRSGSTADVSVRRPYRDYIEWLERRDRAVEEQYWREALAGFGEPTVLAIDAAPGLPPSDVETSDEQFLSLPPAVTRTIEAFAQRQRVTLNTVLQGAWALLLARYSGRDEVVFGTTVSGRPADLSGVEQMIGLFINGLPMRVRVEADLTLADWLQSLQTQHASMRQHEGSSIIDIQGWSDVPRGVRLFDTTYVFENYPEDAGLGAKLSDIGLTRAEVVSNTSSSLHLRVIPGASLSMRVVYDRRRFAPDDMQRILGQLASLVEQFAADADSALSSFTLVTAGEAPQLPDPREPIAAVWSGAAHEHVARAAEAAGDRIAIVDQFGSRSYRWLNERSSQLAQHLVRAGIAREEVVAIYADRSAALVLAMLGVAKSGAAFTMLDPAYPVARHLECLQSTNARGLIHATDSPLPDELREYLENAPLRCRVTLPDDLLLDEYPAESPAIDFEPDDLAYIAFTSGSEGRPKGVLGRHGPLAQYAGWLAGTFGFDQSDRSAMLSAIPHDPLLRDIFPTLQLGATLCIPSPELMGTPARLVDWMHSVGATSCNLTPALARLITDCQGASLPGLRRALIVGEVLSPRDVAALRASAPNATFVNLYGSTEAQQALGYFVVPPSKEIEPGARIPIGRGMDGVQLLVFNAARRPAGVGEVGEICVRTPYLSRGYLNDEPLTWSRFTINPLSGAADDRMYRTGDLGRYLANGDVCFVGRQDRQVKIRGYRVEPGEVEAAILQHDSVREVAVAAHGEDRDARVLVAYVVGAPSVSDLREFLRRRLPSALVPAHIVVMDRLPRTASGKIDRRSLPEPDRAGTTSGYVAPRSPIEQTLARFWADVLGAEQIGLHDNFFDLGGHSLLAARLAARVRQEFQVELPISAVFENPVLGELALVLTRALLDDDAELAQLLDEVKELPDDRAQAIIDDETSGSDAGVSVTS